MAVLISTRCRHRGSRVPDTDSLIPRAARDLSLCDVHRQAFRLAGKQACRQASRQTGTQMNRKASRHADAASDTNTETGGRHARPSPCSTYHTMLECQLEGEGVGPHCEGGSSRPPSQIPSGVDTASSVVLAESHPKAQPRMSEKPRIFPQTLRLSSSMPPCTQTCVEDNTFATIQMDLI